MHGTHGMTVFDTLVHLAIAQASFRAYRDGIEYNRNQKIIQIVYKRFEICFSSHQFISSRAMRSDSRHGLVLD
jgi:hypothetical protein